ncbi:hypothetical protein OFB65_25380, partial [Escherichia coli]|nr:hypothetical protein [Escherichia coli]
ILSEERSWIMLDLLKRTCGQVGTCNQVLVNVLYHFVFLLPLFVSYMKFFIHFISGGFPVVSLLVPLGSFTSVIFWVPKKKSPLFTNSPQDTTGRP